MFSLYIPRSILVAEAYRDLNVPSRLHDLLSPVENRQDIQPECCILCHLPRFEDGSVRVLHFTRYDPGCDCGWEAAHHVSSFLQS
jgi:hypothetical protein